MSANKAGERLKAIGLVLIILAVLVGIFAPAFSPAKHTSATSEEREQWRRADRRNVLYTTGVCVLLLGAGAVLLAKGVASKQSPHS